MSCFSGKICLTLGAVVVPWGFGPAMASALSENFDGLGLTDPTRPGEVVSDRQGLEQRRIGHAKAALQPDSGKNNAEEQELNNLIITLQGRTAVRPHPDPNSGSYLIHEPNRDEAIGSHPLRTAMDDASLVDLATDARVRGSQESDLTPPTLSPEAPLDLDPTMIEESPVLQRWLDEIPNVLADIRHDPSFRTRVRLGYSLFPSTDHASGFNVGLEDVLLGRTGLTVSGDYQATFEGDRQAYGVDLRYYGRPLGRSINIAPVLGYRHLDTDAYTTDGVNLGVRLLLALSRTGAADLSLTQTWVAPGSDREVGITTLSVGYALTQHLRISTDIQKQNAPQSKDSRVGIVFEWML